MLAWLSLAWAPCVMCDNFLSNKAGTDITSSRFSVVTKLAVIPLSVLSC